MVRVTAAVVAVRATVVLVVVLALVVVLLGAVVVGLVSAVPPPQPAPRTNREPNVMQRSWRTTVTAMILPHALAPRGSHARVWASFPLRGSAPSTNTPRQLGSARVRHHSSTRNDGRREINTIGGRRFLRLGSGATETVGNLLVPVLAGVWLAIGAPLSRFTVDGLDRRQCATGTGDAHVVSRS